jgi:hypothetical protein
MQLGWDHNYETNSDVEVPIPFRRLVDEEQAALVAAPSLDDVVVLLAVPEDLPITSTTLSFDEPAFTPMLGDDSVVMAFAAAEDLAASTGLFEDAWAVQVLEGPDAPAFSPVAEDFVQSLPFEESPLVGPFSLDAYSPPTLSFEDLAASTFVALEEPSAAFELTQDAGALLPASPVEDFVQSLPFEESPLALRLPIDLDALPGLAPEDFAGTLALEEPPAALQPTEGGEASLLASAPEDFVQSLPFEESPLAVVVSLESALFAPLPDEDFGGSLPLEESLALVAVVLEESFFATWAGEDFAGAVVLEEGSGALGSFVEEAFAWAASVSEDLTAQLVLEESAGAQASAKEALLVLPTWVDEPLVTAATLPLEESGALQAPVRDALMLGLPSPPEDKAAPSGAAGLEEDAREPLFERPSVYARWVAPEELASAAVVIILPPQGFGAYLSREDYERRRGAWEPLHPSDPFGRYSYEGVDPAKLAEWDALGFGEYSVSKPLTIAEFERRVLLQESSDRDIALFEQRASSLLVRQTVRTRKLQRLALQGAGAFIIYQALKRWK